MPVPPMPFKVMRRLAYAAIGFAAVLVVTIVELNAAGGLQSWQLVTLAAIVAIFGPGQVATRAISNWLGSVSYAQRQRMEEPVKACIVSLAKRDSDPSASLTTLPVTAIGITVFVVLRSPMHLLRGVQKRVVRVRLNSYPAPSEIVWTYRKGLLGECWREKGDASLDHRAYFSDHARCTKKEWKELDKEYKKGLKHKDYVRIREYGYVLAAPLLDHDGHYRGCFVVQVPTGQGDEISSEAALAVIHTSASLTCAVLD